MTSGTMPAPGGSGDGGKRRRGHCHLLFEGGENKRLLTDWLDRDFQVTDGSGAEPLPETFDICLLDGPNYDTHAAALSMRKQEVEPEFLPVLLVTRDEDRIRGDQALWEVVDDVVQTPIRKTELAARIDNLLNRRRTTRQLRARERALAEMNAELQRKDLAMDAAPVGITLTDPHQDGHPITYVNGAFERITGYDREEVLGRGFDFLRGPDTDPERIERLNGALHGEEHVTVTLINYRKNGRRFWNRVEIAPVYDEDGALIAHVSFRTDVTNEQIRQQRLTVLNRVMRHNASNDLNVIMGYARNLRDGEAADDPDAAVDQIIESATDLVKLSEKASWIEQVLGRCRGSIQPTELGEAAMRAVDRFETHHPEGQLQLEIQDAPFHVRGNGLEEAFAELLDNAVRHSGESEPSVRLTIAPDDVRTEHVRVTVADDGPGIPPNIVEVLRRGEETQLIHGDGLGLWLVYWVVTLIGGSIEVATPADGGTVITLRLPTSDPEEP